MYTHRDGNLILYLTQELVDVHSSREPPAYLRSVPTEELARIRTDALRGVQLDETQQAAITLALANRVALIQGPPGTGKTFCGLRVVRMLFEAKRAYESRAGDEAPELNVATLKKHAVKNDYKSYTEMQEEKKAKKEEEEVKAKQDALPQRSLGPILILTYKNHALDQFLLGCLQVRRVCLARAHACMCVCVCVVCCVRVFAYLQSAAREWCNNGPPFRHR
jgi:hypothetical protein